MQSESKNIVICCDGTGNQFGDCNSNVVKIYTMLHVNEHQAAYYHPGLGTMGAPNQTSWVGKKLSQIAGLAFGAGFLSNLGDAYKYLMQQYKEGDKVFLFGFSRGAYTIRALAGSLHAYGLLCPGNEGHLPYLLRLYSDASRKAYSENRIQIPANPLSDAFKETFCRTIPVHFVGIWDTVSSVGWVYDPVKLLFDGQNPIVHIGRHAISIDERRCFFQSNLWGEPLPRNRTPVLEGKQQDIVQAWFAGVHSDVGGSYRQAECAPAQEALRWIVDEAKAAGLLVNEAKQKAVFGEKPPGMDVLNAMYPPPKPFEYLHQSLTPGWWPLELFPHKYFDDTGKKHWQLAPWTHRRELPDGALLHPTVLERLKQYPEYQPKNLKRDAIVSISERHVHLLMPKVEEQLRKDGFRAYRAKAVARPPVPRAIRASVALVGMGLAWSLLKRIGGPR